MDESEINIDGKQKDIFKKISAREICFSIGIQVLWSWMQNSTSWSVGPVTVTLGPETDS